MDFSRDMTWSENLLNVLEDFYLKSLIIANSFEKSTSYFPCQYCLAHLSEFNFKRKYNYIAPCYLCMEPQWDRKTVLLIKKRKINLRVSEENIFPGIALYMAQVLPFWGGNSLDSEFLLLSSLFWLTCMKCSLFFRSGFRV